MKKLLCIALASASVLLTACEQKPPVTQTSSERKEIDVKIVYVKKPKHFRVVVEDLATGKQYRLSGSKHCSQWSNIEVGQKYRIVEYSATYSDGSYAHQLAPRACELARSTKQWSID